MSPALKFHVLECINTGGTSAQCAYVGLVYLLYDDWIQSEYDGIGKRAISYVTSALHVSISMYVNTIPAVATSGLDVYLELKTRRTKRCCQRKFILTKLKIARQSI